MRRVLVDHARRAQAHKRGENPIGLSLDSIEAGVDVRHELVDLDAALTKLAAQAPQPARVVELRYFGGLSIEDTGALRRRVSGFADGQLGDASGDGWPDPGSVHQRFRHGCRGGGRRTLRAAAHTAHACCGTSSAATGRARIQIDNVVLSGPGAATIPVSLNFHLRGTLASNPDFGQAWVVLYVALSGLGGSNDTT
jgi:hypothetical protein